MNLPDRTSTNITTAIIPIIVLLSLIGYGLVYLPFAGQNQLPLELIFILATIGSVVHLFAIGHRWKTIEAHIVSRFSKAFPAFLILFSIGLVIGSWMVCGTIPMLVAWGLQSIDPQYLYAIAFGIPIIFSTLTGTSWGSVGTIGLVLIGIARAMDADLGITAGAIIGGAYFGDKLSPLSDTTNMAALGAGVDLYDHIRSMLWTTVPSATIAFVVFWFAGSNLENAPLDSLLLQQVIDGLNAEFSFSIWLLLPPLFVVIGSLLRLSPVPVLLGSVLIAGVLALVTQPFSVNEIFASLKSGFHVEMLRDTTGLSTEVNTIFEQLLNRGGLYALNEPIIIAMMVFVFIGTLDVTKAMPTVVQFAMQKVESARITVVSSLLLTAATSALTSSQYAVSFIIGDAFQSRFDRLKIPRPVLSRSLEDTGTMLESLVPWHPASIYMVATLGVSYAEYAPWQILSLANFGVAFLLAITGIGCAYGQGKQHPEPESQPSNADR